jgi:hypothetical protein
MEGYQCSMGTVSCHNGWSTNGSRGSRIVAQALSMRKEPDASVVADFKVANKTLGMKFSMLNLKIFWNLMRFGFGRSTVYIFRLVEDLKPTDDECRILTNVGELLSIDALFYLRRIHFSSTVL